MIFFILSIYLKALRAANIKSARFDVRSEARVLLYTNRAIIAGERLCYDYNALAENQYATSAFE